jgi:hypothetical protein
MDEHPNEQALNEKLPAAATPVPKSDGFGKPDSPRQRQRGPRVRVVLRPRPRESRLPGASPEQTALWFVQQFTRQYPRLTRADKKLLLARIQRQVPPYPRPGRPCRTDVTQALQFEGEGVSRKEIYRRLGKATREEQHALREAMRQRKARSRKRDKSATVTPTNPA